MSDAEKALAQTLRAWKRGDATEEEMVASLREALFSWLRSRTDAGLPRRFVVNPETVLVDRGGDDQC